MGDNLASFLVSYAQIKVCFFYYMLSLKSINPPLWIKIESMTPEQQNQHYQALEEAVNALLKEPYYEVLEPTTQQILDKVAYRPTLIRKARKHFAMQLAGINKLLQECLERERWTQNKINISTDLNEQQWWEAFMVVHVKEWRTLLQKQASHIEFALRMLFDK